MTRLVAVFSVFLLSSCFAVAQNPASAPAAAALNSAATSAESPQIHEFQKIEDSWSTAINMRDQYALELVLSPLFVDVSAGGDITTRNQQLAQLITLEDKTLNLEQKVVAVRTLGDIAVANGTYVLHHKVGAGEVDEKGVFTHVFEKTHGGWVCINSQRTKLPVDVGGKQRKKPSQDEVPFHIPFLGKSDKSPQ
ncbi:MAG: nuclear transport factor 2 family protein [Terracidiphilus sp.]|jgi:ketosteroid isomerase-like protein